MSQENVETCWRSVDLFNRRDVEAWLEYLDPEVELHWTLFAMLGGGATVFRGHEGVREYLRDLDEAFAEFQIAEISEIRDLGERVSQSVSFAGGAGIAGPRSSRPSRTWSSSRTAGSFGWTTSSTPRRPRSRRAVGVGDVGGERPLS